MLNLSFFYMYYTFRKIFDKRYEHLLKQMFEASWVKIALGILELVLDKVLCILSSDPFDTKENDWIVRLRFLSTNNYFEVLIVHPKSLIDVANRDVDSSGNSATRLELTRFTYIDENGIAISKFLFYFSQRQNPCVWVCAHTTA